MITIETPDYFKSFFGDKNQKPLKANVILDFEKQSIKIYCINNNTV